MKIGFLKKIKTSNGEELHGQIRSLEINLRIKICPNTYKVKEHAPDYIVKCPTSEYDVQVGAAWKKIKTRADGAVEFLSVTIDDPSLPLPLYLFAFTQNDEDWELIWNRPISKNNPPIQTQSA